MLKKLKTKLRLLTQSTTQKELFKLTKCFINMKYPRDSFKIQKPLRQSEKRNHDQRYYQVQFHQAKQHIFSNR